MNQDLLTRVHRWSRRVAPMLGPFRVVARRAFRFALGLRYRGSALMRADQNDRRWLLVPEVALRGAFAEFETTLWLREVVKAGACVFDIGANVGQMTLESAVLVGPTGRVVAIEPAPGNLAILKLHLEANELAARVTVIDGACTDHHGGVVKLFVGGENENAVGSGHTLAGAEAINKLASEMPVHQRDVPAVSVDGLCAQLGVSPSAIKIDVEGAEVLVLRGAVETLRRSRPVVRVGFHPFAFEDPIGASDELRAIFRSVGYRFDGPEAGSLSLSEYVAAPESLA